MEISNITQKKTLAGNLLFAALFAISYSQGALYTTNQNTYFLHGLANGNMGNLSSDWIVNTLDPFPVFSLLTNITYTYTSSIFFHIYHFVFLCLFIFCGMKIIAMVFGIEESFRNVSYVGCFAFITLTFSFAFSWLSLKVLGTSIRELWADGVAIQTVLGDVFLPSMFGIMLFLSVLQFLKDKIIQSVLCMIVAIWFHPSYLLTGALLTLAYMTIIWVKEKNVKKMFLVGTTSLLLVTPVLYYNILFFDVTTSEASRIAQNILIEYRFPHHAKFDAWFGLEAVLKVAFILLSLLIVRNHKLFFIILIPFTGSLLLTTAQVITESNFLALIFPWRVSTFLVPLSFLVIVGWLFSVVQEKVKQMGNIYVGTAIRFSSIFLIIICAVAGVAGIFREYKYYKQAEHNAMLAYVAATADNEQVFLVPTDLESFRLGTGSPIFVDQKTHPYKDVEVLEWYKRMQLSSKFYASKNHKQRCEILSKMLLDYKITHIVSKEEFKNCVLVEKVYADSKYYVFKIKPNKEISSGVPAKSSALLYK